MVDELPPEDVEAKLEEGDVQVVDIRSPSQFERGHIPGAINVPLSELPRQVDEVDWGDQIVCVCPIGKSSIQAAKLIRSYEGVDEDAHVASMKGGYREWDGTLEEGPSDVDSLRE
ncbi:rhodanese-like domain-containing protein [Haloparvum sp. AD34]